MKNSMEYCISRDIKTLSPFVYSEIFKKCAGRVGDYAVIEICKDPFDQYNVLFKIVEPDYYKRFNVPTCTWEHMEPIKVVLVKLEENQMIMVEYDELAKIIRQYQLNHSEEFEKITEEDKFLHDILGDRNGEHSEDDGETP